MENDHEKEKSDCSYERECTGTESTWNHFTGSSGTPDFYPVAVTGNTCNFADGCIYPSASDTNRGHHS